MYSLRPPPQQELYPIFMLPKWYIMAISINGPQNNSPIFIFIFNLYIKNTLSHVVCWIAVWIRSIIFYLNKNLKLYFNYGLYCNGPNKWIMGRIICIGSFLKFGVFKLHKINGVLFIYNYKKGVVLILVKKNIYIWLVLVVCVEDRKQSMIIKEEIQSSRFKNSKVSLSTILNKCHHH